MWERGCTHRTCCSVLGCPGPPTYVGLSGKGRESEDGSFDRGRDNLYTYVSYVRDNMYLHCLYICTHASGQTEYPVRSNSAITGSSDHMRS